VCGEWGLQLLAWKNKMGSALEKDPSMINNYLHFFHEPVHELLAWKKKICSTLEKDPPMINNYLQFLHKHTHAISMEEQNDLFP
jgi:hypothetical protein